MRNADQKLRDIRSGRDAGLAIGQDVSRNVFYLAAGLTVVFAVWCGVSGFAGWRLYALAVCVLAAVAAKVIETVFKRRLA